MILPWIYGFATKVYKSLANTLNHPAFILQLSDISGYSNLDELTRKLESNMIELFKDVDNFILIGHCFGALLALKIAKILENNGKVGQIIQLNGSPQFNSRFARKMLNDGLFGDMKGYISMLLFDHYQSKLNPNLTKILIEKHNDWEYKTKELLSLSRKQIPPKYDHLMEDFPAAFTNRLNISLSTKENDFCFLKSTKISLIKANKCSLNGIHRDYGLSKYTSGDVKIKIVEGNHEMLLDNPKLPKLLANLICN